MRTEFASASGSKSTYRGLGSIDFQATVRSVLVVGRIKDDTTLRVIAHDKSSLAPEGTSIAFRMDKDNGFIWEGVYDITVEELLSGESRGQKTKDAKSFLAEILAEGQLSCNEITEAAKERGIKKKTLWNAKKVRGTSALHRPKRSGDLGVRAQLERMKELCKERNSLYEKQNDLKGQKQKIEKSLER